MDSSGSITPLLRRHLQLGPLPICRAPLSALFIGPASSLNKLHACYPILDRRECRAELLRRQCERPRHESARELSIKVRKSQRVSLRVTGPESRCLQGFKAKLVVPPRPPHPGSADGLMPQFLRAFLLPSEISRFTKDLESQTMVMAGGHIAAPDPPSDALFEDKRQVGVIKHLPALGKGHHIRRHLLRG